MVHTEIDLTADIIDVRDLIARFEELEDAYDEATDTPERWEARSLKEVLDNIRGHGGDEQWRGDWYPLTLIRGSYFEDYAQEFAADFGALDESAKWPMSCIDWEAAARELQMYYASVDIDGVDYWFR